ncbi:MAG: hypothetical protein GY953_10000 [bacterium]|nr:hypothetical protein [bacterium]
MSRNFTRREMAAALVAAAPAAARAQQPGQTDPLAKARSQLREAIEAMEKVDLEMTAEPAFVFKP